MTEEFPANSRSAARNESEQNEGEGEARKKFDPIVQGSVTRRKKPLGRRFMDTFFSGGFDGLVEHLIKEVFVPAMQDAAADMFREGIDRVFRRDGSSSSSSRSYRASRTVTPVTRTHVSYDRYGPSRPTSAVSSMRQPVRSTTLDLDQIVLTNKIDAEQVLDKLYDIVQEYQGATVADLNDLLGQTSNYTDHKWGWDDLAGCDVKRVSGGYLLILPRPIPIRSN